MTADKVRVPHLSRDHAIHVLADYISEGIKRKRKGDIAEAFLTIQSALRDLFDARGETETERNLRVRIAVLEGQRMSWAAAQSRIERGAELLRECRLFLDPILPRHAALLPRIHEHLENVRLGVAGDPPA